MRLRTTVEAATGLGLTLACLLVGRAVLQPGEPRPEVEPEPSGPLPAVALHAEEAASYAMTASLSPEQHVVHGAATIAWRNASRVAVRELYVHLYLNAFRNSQSIWMQERKPGEGRGSGALWSFGAIDVRRFAVREQGGQDLWAAATNAHPEHPHDLTDMRVPLASEVAPGAVIHIEVEWDSTLPNVLERTGFSGSFHMVAQWFPKVARLEEDGTFAHFPFHHLSEFYADFGSYSVEVDVPEAYRIAAVGERVSESVENGRRKERFEQSDIHDFAFAAWDRFSTRDGEAEGVKLRVWYPQGFDALAQEQLEAASYAIRHFGRRYGPYPYGRLTIVSPPPDAMEAGGMEYPTLVTTGGQWYWPSWLGLTRGVTIHEFGHNYFYGLVATDEHRWPFLDEGLTQYAEFEALESGWGPGAMLDVAGLRIGAPAAARVFALLGNNVEPIAQPAEAFASASAYSTLVYGRTSLILKTMERAYPGSVSGTLARYARANRFRHPGPQELYSAFEAQAGKAAREQLELALEHRGWLDYAVRRLSCETRRAPFGRFAADASTVAQDDAAVEGQSCEVIVDRHGSMKLPVEIELVTEGGERIVRQWDGDNEPMTIRHEGASPLAWVVVDPGHKVLLDSDLSNNALRWDGRKRATNVSWGATFAAMVAMAGVTP